MIITDQNTLRKKCENVSTEEVDELINLLELELKKSGDVGRPGIGLAAPQIGINKKAAIIRLKKININLINAKIVEKNDPFIFENEGCLSFPGKFEKTNRYKEIVVENDVEPKKFVATDLVAVAIQHELDHLDGILLPDVAIKKKKVRPNDPCPCGKKDEFTGLAKKYKKCHGR